MIPNIMKFGSSLALLLIAYIPTIKWMVDRWVAPESYYGHGFLIPAVSLFFIWQKIGALKKVKLTGDFFGAFIVVAMLFIHIICASLKVYFISGCSFVFAIYGLILFSFGREFARKLIFPVFFLLAMIPLPLVAIGNLTVKLKLFAAEVATVILNHIGFPSIREGSIIRMPGSFIAIEAPCSGLRSLISLLTLGLIFAYVTKVSYIKKGMIFISSVPIAIATNVTRILMLATVNDLYGQKVAMGFFHDFSGFFVFGLAFLALFGVARALEGKEAA